MRNTPLRGLLKKSPLRTNTELADRIFTKSRVDESLRKRGEHTEGKLRGTPNTAITSGGNNQMIDPNA